MMKEILITHQKPTFFCIILSAKKSILQKMLKTEFNSANIIYN